MGISKGMSEEELRAFLRTLTPRTQRIGEVDLSDSNIWIQSSHYDWLIDFGTAYHKSAAHLVDIFFRNDKSGSFDGLPAIFLYRHSIELLLKAIGVQLVLTSRFKNKPVKALKDDVKNYLQGHSIEYHLQKVCEDLKRVQLSFSLTILNEVELKRRILDLENLDSGSFTFRYPTGKDGSPSIPKTFKLNLRSFKEKYDPVVAELTATAEDIPRDLLITQEQDELRAP